MPLSHSVKFPLLKLPRLCIKCVIHNSNEFDLILFATISNRTRRIVKISKYPLKEIIVSPSSGNLIVISDLVIKNKNVWHFLHDSYAYNGNLVLQLGSHPLRTSRDFEYYLRSYTAGDKLDALKVGIDFIIDVFGCTIKRIIVDGDKLSELFGLGITSVKELFIFDDKPVNITDLKNLLKTIKVTHSYEFYAPIPSNFSCDPQIFKCRRLSFWHSNSADWVTLEVLCQLDVPELHFLHHRFSVKDLVSYITYWFNSENRMLEHLFVSFNSPISLEDFEIDHLNPMPFCEKRRNRCPFVGGWKEKDMSSGMDIIRKDGLLATLYVESKSIIFYIWHKRFPDSVQQ